MTPEEARAVIEHGCVGKRAYSARAARAIAASIRASGDRRVGAYRCHAVPEHWHVGHQPSVEGLQRLALALRVLAGNAPR